MYQVDDATASPTLPTPAAAGTSGYYTDGNPGSGVAATILRADFMNAVMLEIMNVVTATGITLSKTAQNQMLLSIKRLVQSQVVLTDTGAVNAYAAANNPALITGTWSNGVVQQIVVAHTNTGASTYAPDSLPSIPIYGLGLQPLQGGEMFAGGTAILMKQTIAGVNSGNPIAVLLECAGGAQQIPQATQTLHAMQLGQATGRLLGAPQVFASAGIYTRNPLATLVIVEGAGGGAGSGGAPAAASAQVSGSAGSTSGSYALVAFTAAQIGASQSVSPGAAGAGGASGSSTGGVGGTSTFGSLMSLPGGNPSSSFGPSGASFVVSAAPGPANAPTISTGVVLKQSRGNQGSPAIGGSGGGVVGGLAGPSPMEGGVAGAGAGANGPGVSNAGASNGVAGNPGKFIVYEYA